MKKVIFDTGIKRIEFGLDGPYILTNIKTDDFDISVQSENYPDTDGETESELLYNSRVVPIKGYIRADEIDSLSELRKRLVSVCNGKQSGKLIVMHDDKTYFSIARPRISPSFGDEIQNYQEFSLEFKLPEFYWRQIKPDSFIALYKRTDLIENTFTLPCVFTSRISKNTIHNLGDVPSDMLITVTCVSDTAQTGNVIQIKNNTTGDVLKIKYDMTVGETITVNTADCSVSSSIAGDILHKMTVDSDFYKLPVGESEIEASSSGGNLNEQLEHYDTFVGVGLC